MEEGRKRRGSSGYEESAIQSDNGGERARSMLFNNNNSTLGVHRRMRTHSDRSSDRRPRLLCLTNHYEQASLRESNRLFVSYKEKHKNTGDTPYIKKIPICGPPRLPVHTSVSETGNTGSRASSWAAYRKRAWRPASEGRSTCVAVSRTVWSSFRSSEYFSTSSCTWVGRWEEEGADSSM